MDSPFACATTWNASMLAYSLLKREIESDILPLCQREQIAVVPYQVLQGGVLTGKYQRDVLQGAYPRATCVGGVVGTTGGGFLDSRRQAH